MRDHKDERSDAIVESLQRAGVPAEFRAKTASLAQYKDAQGVEEFRNIIASNIPISAGSVLTVAEHKRIGSGAALTYMIARALVLSGRKVKCIMTPMLVEGLRSEEKTDSLKETISECDTFVLVGFYDTHYKTCPYSDELLSRLEWIIDGMLMNEKNVVLHMTGVASIMKCDWYSPRLLNRINSKLSTPFLI